MRTRHHTAIFRKHRVPINPALSRALDSGDRKRIFLAEQAYLLRLLASPKGEDFLFIQNALGAHYKLDVDLKRVKDHLQVLTEKGLVEKHQGGRYRVKPKCINICKQMLEDQGAKVRNLEE